MLIYWAFCQNVNSKSKAFSTLVNEQINKSRVAENETIGNLVGFFLVEIDTV